MTYKLPKKIRVKATALFVAVLFILETAAWAAPASLHEVLSTAYNVQRDGIQVPNHKVQIPSSLGKITEFFHAVRSTNDAVLVHIEDAHGEPEAQKNTQAILEHLKKEYGIHTFFLEGAWSKLEPALLQFSKNPDQNEKILEELTEKGIVGGPENFLFGNSRYSVQRKEYSDEVEGYGIEDLELYKKNLHQFRAVLGAKAESDVFLNEMKSGLLTKASQVLNPELANYFRQWSFHEEVESDYSAHLRALAEFAQKHLALDLNDAREQYDWPMLIRYQKLKAFEADKRSTSHAPRATNLKIETNRLVEWLGKNGFEKERESFKGLSVARGSWSPPRRAGVELGDVRQFFEEFYEQASPLGFKFKDYPELSKEWGKQILSQELDAPTLLKEVETLENKLIEKLAQTPDEKKLIAKYREYLLLRKLLHLEFSKTEWQGFRGAVLDAKQRRLTPMLFKIVEQANNFYATAEARDAAMFSRTLAWIKKEKIEKAAIITGGFHSEGMGELLKQKNISYLRVQPRITQIHGRENYLKLMMRAPSTSEVATPNVATSDVEGVSHLRAVSPAEPSPIEPPFFVANQPSTSQVKSRSEVPPYLKEMLDELAIPESKQVEWLNQRPFMELGGGRSPVADTVRGMRGHDSQKPIYHMDVLASGEGALKQLFQAPWPTEIDGKIEVLFSANALDTNIVHFYRPQWPVAKEGPMRLHEDIAQNMAKALSPNGIIIVLTNNNQGEAIYDALEEAGLYVWWGKGLKNRVFAAKMPREKWMLRRSEARERIWDMREEGIPALAWPAWVERALGWFGKETKRPFQKENAVLVVGLDDKLDLIRDWLAGFSDEAWQEQFSGYQFILANEISAAEKALKKLDSRMRLIVAGPEALSLERDGKLIKLRQADDFLAIAAEDARIPLLRIENDPTSGDLQMTRVTEIPEITLSKAEFSEELFFKAVGELLSARSEMREKNGKRDYFELIHEGDMSHLIEEVGRGRRIKIRLVGNTQGRRLLEELEYLLLDFDSAEKLSLAPLKKGRRIAYLRPDGSDTIYEMPFSGLESGDWVYGKFPASKVRAKRTRKRSPEDNPSRRSFLYWLMWLGGAVGLGVTALNEVLLLTYQKEARKGYPRDEYEAVIGTYDSLTGMGIAPQDIFPASPYMLNEDNEKKPLGFFRGEGEIPENLLHFNPHGRAQARGLFLIDAEGRPDIFSVQDFKETKEIPRKWVAGFQSGPLLFKPAKRAPKGQKDIILNDAVFDWVRRRDGRKVVVGLNKAESLYVLELWGRDAIGITGPQPESFELEVRKWVDDNKIVKGIFLDGGTTGTRPFQIEPLIALGFRKRPTPLSPVNRSEARITVNDIKDFYTTFLADMVKRLGPEAARHREGLLKLAHQFNDLQTPRQAFDLIWENIFAFEKLIQEKTPTHSNPFFSLNGIGPSELVLMTVPLATFYEHLCKLIGSYSPEELEFEGEAFLELQKVRLHLIKNLLIEQSWSSSPNTKEEIRERFQMMLAALFSAEELDKKLDPTRTLSERFIWESLRDYNLLSSADRSQKNVSPKMASFRLRWLKRLHEMLPGTWIRIINLVENEISKLIQFPTFSDEELSELASLKMMATMRESWDTKDKLPPVDVIIKQRNSFEVILLHKLDQINNADSPKLVSEEEDSWVLISEDWRGRIFDAYARQTSELFGQPLDVWDRQKIDSKLNAGLAILNQKIITGYEHLTGALQTWGTSSWEEMLKKAGLAEKNLNPKDGMTARRLRSLAQALKIEAHMQMGKLDEANLEFAVFMENLNDEDFGIFFLLPRPILKNLTTLSGNVFENPLTWDGEDSALIQVIKFKLSYSNDPIKYDFYGDVDNLLNSFLPLLQDKNPEEAKIVRLEIFFRQAIHERHYALLALLTQLASDEGPRPLVLNVDFRSRLKKLLLELAGPLSSEEQLKKLISIGTLSDLLLQGAPPEMQPVAMIPLLFLHKGLLYALGAKAGGSPVDFRATIEQMLKPEADFQPGVKKEFRQLLYRDFLDWVWHFSFVQQAKKRAGFPITWPKEWGQILQILAEEISDKNYFNEKTAKNSTFCIFKIVEAMDFWLKTLPQDNLEVVKADAFESALSVTEKVIWYLEGVIDPKLKVSSSAGIPLEQARTSILYFLILRHGLLRARGEKDLMLKDMLAFSSALRAYMVQNGTTAAFWKDETSFSTLRTVVAYLATNGMAFALRMMAMMPDFDPLGEFSREVGADTNAGLNDLAFAARVARWQGDLPLRNRLLELIRARPLSDVNRQEDLIQTLYLFIAYETDLAGESPKMPMPSDLFEVLKQRLETLSERDPEKHRLFQAWRLIFSKNKQEEAQAILKDSQGFESDWLRFFSKSSQLLMSQNSPSDIKQLSQRLQDFLFGWLAHTSSLELSVSDTLELFLNLPENVLKNLTLAMLDMLTDSKMDSATHEFIFEIMLILTQGRLIGGADFQLMRDETFATAYREIQEPLPAIEGERDAYWVRQAERWQRLASAYDRQVEAHPKHADLLVMEMQSALLRLKKQVGPTHFIFKSSGKKNKKTLAPWQEMNDKLTRELLRRNLLVYQMNALYLMGEYEYLQSEAGKDIATALGDSKNGGKKIWDDPVAMWKRRAKAAADSQKEISKAYQDTAKVDFKVVQMSAEKFLSEINAGDPVIRVIVENCVRMQNWLELNSENADRVLGEMEKVPLTHWDKVLDTHYAKALTLHVSNLLETEGIHATDLFLEAEKTKKFAMKAAKMLSKQVKDLKAHLDVVNNLLGQNLPEEAESELNTRKSPFDSSQSLSSLPWKEVLAVKGEIARQKQKIENVLQVIRTDDSLDFDAMRENVRQIFNYREYRQRALEALSEVAKKIFDSGVKANSFSRPDVPSTPFRKAYFIGQLMYELFAEWKSLEPQADVEPLKKRADQIISQSAARVWLPDLLSSHWMVSVAYYEEKARLENGELNGERKKTGPRPISFSGAYKAKKGGDPLTITLSGLGIGNDKLAEKLRKGELMQIRPSTGEKSNHFFSVEAVNKDTGQVMLKLEVSEEDPDENEKKLNGKTPEEILEELLSLLPAHKDTPTGWLEWVPNSKLSRQKKHLETVLYQLNETMIAELSWDEKGRVSSTGNDVLNDLMGLRRWSVHDIDPEEKKEIEGVMDLLLKFLKEMDPDHVRELDSAQSGAVMAAASSGARFALFHGPPGTGKTEALFWLVKILQKLEISLRMYAHAHRAIDNLLKRLLRFNQMVQSPPASLADNPSLAKQAASEQIEFARGGNNPDAISPDIRPFWEKRILILNNMLKRWSLFAGTIDGLPEDPSFSNQPAGAVIADEGGLITLVDIIVMALLTDRDGHVASKLILAGDPQQLPPFGFSKEQAFAIARGLGSKHSQSYFDDWKADMKKQPALVRDAFVTMEKKLSVSISNRQFLENIFAPERRLQFRISLFQKAIDLFFDPKFYDPNIFTTYKPPYFFFDTQRRAGKRSVELQNAIYREFGGLIAGNSYEGVVLNVDTRGLARQEEVPISEEARDVNTESGTSLRNPGEANAVLDSIANLINEESLPPKAIGMISFYNGQVDYIRKAVKSFSAIHAYLKTAAHPEIENVSSPTDEEIEALFNDPDIEKAIQIRGERYPEMKEIKTNLKLWASEPKSAQAALKRLSLGENFIPWELVAKGSFLTTHVVSVDSVIGTEFDAVILSWVRSNSDGNLGFLTAPVEGLSRINVGTSREGGGRYLKNASYIVSIGDRTTFEKNENPEFKEWFEYVWALFDRFYEEDMASGDSEKIKRWTFATSRFRSEMRNVDKVGARSINYREVAQALDGFSRIEEAVQRLLDGLTEAGEGEREGFVRSISALLNKPANFFGLLSMPGLMEGELSSFSNKVDEWKKAEAALLKQISGKENFLPQFYQSAVADILDSLEAMSKEMTKPHLYRQYLSKRDIHELERHFELWVRQRLESFQKPRHGPEEKFKAKAELAQLVKYHGREEHLSHFLIQVLRDSPDAYIVPFDEYRNPFSPKNFHLMGSPDFFLIQSKENKITVTPLKIASKPHVSHHDASSPEREQVQQKLIRSSGNDLFAPLLKEGKSINDMEIEVGAKVAIKLADDEVSEKLNTLTFTPALVHHLLSRSESRNSNSPLILSDAQFEERWPKAISNATEVLVKLDTEIESMLELGDYDTDVLRALMDERKKIVAQYDELVLPRLKDHTVMRAANLNTLGPGGPKEQPKDGGRAKTVARLKSIPTVIKGVFEEALPHFFTLQEATLIEGTINNAWELADALNYEYETYFYKKHGGGIEGPFEEGLAILWHRSFAKKATFRLDLLSSNPSDPMQRRVLLGVQLHSRITNEELYVFTTHLDYSSPEIRKRQLDQIKEFIAQNVPKGARVVLTGDFNFDDWRERDAAAGEYVDTFRRANPEGLGMTFSKNNPLNPYGVSHPTDAIFSSDSLKVVDARIVRGPDVVSDHHMVVADLKSNVAARSELRVPDNLQALLRSFLENEIKRTLVKRIDTIFSSEDIEEEILKDVIQKGSYQNSNDFRARFRALYKDKRFELENIDFSALSNFIERQLTNDDGTPVIVEPKGETTKPVADHVIDGYRKGEFHALPGLKIVEEKNPGITAKIKKILASNFSDLTEGVDYDIHTGRLLILKLQQPVNGMEAIQVKGAAFEGLGRLDDFKISSLDPALSPAEVDRIHRGVVSPTYTAEGIFKLADKSHSPVGGMHRYYSEQEFKMAQLFSSKGIPAPVALAKATFSNVTNKKGELLGAVIEGLPSVGKETMGDIVDQSINIAFDLSPDHVSRQRAIQNIQMLSRAQGKMLGDLNQKGVTHLQMHFGNTFLTEKKDHGQVADSRKAAMDLHYSDLESALDQKEDNLTDAQFLGYVLISLHNALSRISLTSAIGRTAREPMALNAGEYFLQGYFGRILSDPDLSPYLQNADNFLNELDKTIRISMTQPVQVIDHPIVNAVKAVIQNRSEAREFDFVELVQRDFGDKTNLKIVDLGAGSLEFLLALKQILAPKGYKLELHAVDESWPYDSDRESAAENGIILHSASLPNLPIEGSFDIVTVNAPSGMLFSQLQPAIDKLSSQGFVVWRRSIGSMDGMVEHLLLEELDENRYPHIHVSGRFTNLPDGSDTFPLPNLPVVIKKQGESFDPLIWTKEMVLQRTRSESRKANDKTIAVAGITDGIVSVKYLSTLTPEEYEFLMDAMLGPKLEESGLQALKLRIELDDLIVLSPDLVKKGFLNEKQIIGSQLFALYAARPDERASLEALIQKNGFDGQGFVFETIAEFNQKASEYGVSRKQVLAGQDDTLVALGLLTQIDEPLSLTNSQIRTMFQHLGLDSLILEIFGAQEMLRSA